MAWFKTKDGKLVEVTHAVDIKEWEAVGYKQEKTPKGEEQPRSVGRPPVQNKLGEEL